MPGRLAVGLVLFALAPAGAAPDAHYKVLAKATLGGEGGWDLLAVDEGARHLFIARSTRVMVVDADTLKPVGEIPDTAGVHGVALAADVGRGFTSNGRPGTSTIFDLKTLKRVGEAKTGQNPDAILYDPATHRVFVFNAGSSDATVIEASDGKVAGTIALGGKPEIAVADGKGGVFVNLEDKSEIASIDARDMKVKAHWPLAPCEDPSGIAMDAAHRRVFSVCGNKLMAVVDADSGRVVTTVPIGQGADGAAFDPGSQMAFSPNGRDGTLTVVHETAPDRFGVVETVPTERGARTIAFDPTTHHLYSVTAQFGPPPSPTAEQPRPRPAMVPGTFEVLVVGR